MPVSRLNTGCENCMENKGVLRNPVFFRILLILIWAQNTIWHFVVEVIERLPVVNVLAEFVMPVCIILFIILSLPYFAAHLRAGDLFVYLIALLVVGFTLLFYPDNEEYIFEDLQRVLLAAVPMYYLGASYEHDACKKDLFWFSLLGVIAMMAYQFYYVSTGRVVLEDNMDAAYNVLPSILYLGYWAFDRKKIRYWLIFILSSVLLFMYGTRGPILAVVVFVALEIFARLIISRAHIKMFVLCVLIFAFLLILFTTDLFTSLIEALSQLFERLGFSTRIFDMFLEGDLSYSSGRDKLREKVFATIWENPLFGYGIFGDRVITDGSYVHNIFVELWCNFGILLGTALIIALIILIIKTIRCSCNTSVFYFVILLISAVFTKLMLSGSYLTEQYFFFLIGLSVKCIRDYKRRKKEDERLSDKLEL